MRQIYLMAGLAIAVDAIIIAIACIVISLIYWLATGAQGAYLALLANLLFFVGALILLFGSLVEFLHFSGTREIYRLLMSSYRLIERTGWIKAECEQEEHEAGWALVFLGAALIVLSIAASFQYIF